ncbi:MAG: alpha/beta fold hydrolase [Boseongicola sp.]|nr:MAG: alpha/beta fold hydrolase [Boseongicola sp.]
MKNDTAYENGAFIPDAAEYPDRWADAARAHRELQASIGRARLNVSYGPSEREKLDIFHPTGAAKGLIVFIHGGYWRRFDRSFWSHMSAGLTAHDWAVAMPSYPLAPEVHIRQITLCMARAAETAAGLVAGPIRLTGHSAGGHLVARLGCRDIVLDEDVRKRIDRIVPISPVADLRPLLETSMNADLGLDDDEANSESPVLHAPPDVSVDVWVGGEERPAFLDQARWLAETWSGDLHHAPGRHHFDVIELLEEKDSPLVSALVREIAPR